MFSNLTLKKILLLFVLSIFSFSSYGSDQDKCSKSFSNLRNLSVMVLNRVQESARQAKEQQARITEASRARHEARQPIYVEFEEVSDAVELNEGDVVGDNAIGEVVNEEVPSRLRSIVNRVQESARQAREQEARITEASRARHEARQPIDVEFEEVSDAVEPKEEDAVGDNAIGEIVNEEVPSRLRSIVNRVQESSQRAREQQARITEASRARRLGNESGVHADSVFMKSIEDLGLDVRTTNNLKAEGIDTIGKLVSKTREEVLEVPDIGKFRADLIEVKLSEENLSLGMNVDNLSHQREGGSPVAESARRLGMAAATRVDGAIVSSVNALERGARTTGRVVANTANRVAPSQESLQNASDRIRSVSDSALSRGRTALDRIQEERRRNIEQARSVQSRREVERIVRNNLLNTTVEEYFLGDRPKLDSPTLPAQPNVVYRDTWGSWGDFLGKTEENTVENTQETVEKETSETRFMDYSTAQKYVQSIGIKSAKEFREWHMSMYLIDKLPDQINYVVDITMLTRQDLLELGINQEAVDFIERKFFENNLFLREEPSQSNIMDGLRAFWDRVQEIRRTEIERNRVRGLSQEEINREDLAEAQLTIAVMNEIVPKEDKITSPVSYERARRLYPHSELPPWDVLLSQYSEVHGNSQGFADFIFRN